MIFPGRARHSQIRLTTGSRGITVTHSVSSDYLNQVRAGLICLTVPLSP